MRDESRKMEITKIVITDGRRTKQEIWRSGDTMYYKQGVSDPDYCVLKFTALRGRHYCDLKTESFEFEDLE